MTLIKFDQRKLKGQGGAHMRSAAKVVQTDKYGVTKQEMCKMPDGHMECPECGSPWMAILKMGTKLGIGCKDCSWETYIDFEDYGLDSGIIKL